jgi:GNAT superfamily N-acetyltransferase
MFIREAAIEDSANISDLIRPLAEKYIACEFSPDGARNLLVSMETDAIERYFKSGFKYHVAVEDDVLAGVVGIRENKHVYHLFVADFFCGRGLARELWHVARDACRQAGNPGDFTVNSSKFAVEMYRKFGFVESSAPVTKNGVVSIPMRLSELEK